MGCPLASLVNRYHFQIAGDEEAWESWQGSSTGVRKITQLSESAPCAWPERII